MDKIVEYIGPGYSVGCILTISRGTKHVDVPLSAAELFLDFEALKSRIIDPALSSLRRAAEQS